MKKNQYCGLGVPISAPGKIFLKMKMVVVFTLMLNVSVSAVTYSQANKVTLRMNNVSLEEVLQVLREQTAVSFFYSIDKVKAIRPVSVDAREQDLKEVLGGLLRNTSLSFTYVDDVVVIKDKPADSGSPADVKSVEIRGKVKDTQGNPLPGVGVLIKGTSIGTTTDADGVYALPLKNTQDVTLVFSFIGMKRLEVKPGERKVVDVVMEEEISKLDEVVVTGYFERRKDSYTGSATTFSGDQLKQISTGNILNTLSMLDPSFKLMENLDAGSNPNYVPEFTIHGGGNLQSDYENSPNMPTFILDGFEVTSEKIFDLDPNRVASVTILKDAAATAIYGSRAANGVVVVETKVPEMGKLRVSYNFSGDFEIADLTDYNLMDASEKLEYERLAGLYSHPNVQIGDQYMDRYNERLALVKSGINTDWIAKPVKDVGFSHKHSLFVEGGDARLRYGLSLNYQNKKGVLRGSGRDNLGVGVQLQYRFKSLKFMNDLTFNHMKMTDSPYGDFSEYTWLNPYYYPYDENGNVKKVLYTFEDESRAYNPMYNATLGTKYEKGYDDFINNFSLEWDIVEGLKMKSKISLNRKNLSSDQFKPADHTDFASETSYKGSYTKMISSYFSYDASVTLAYTKRLNKHQFNAVAVWNVKQSKTDKFETTAYNFPNNNMDHIGMGVEYKEGDQPSGDYEVSRLMGIVANFNYGYDDRYLVDFSVRSDGSSMFGADKRWGTFGSVGLGWNIHNESWLKGSPWVNLLKIRGSWGTTGGQNFYPYQAMMMFSYKDDMLNVKEDEDKMLSGHGYDGFIGALLKAYGNNDLKWQRTEKLNVGADFTLLNNRLSGYFNFYKETSKSVLIDVLVAPSLGFTSYKDNLGEVENKGIEFNLRGTLIQNTGKQLQWDVFASIVKNRNRLLKLSDALVAWNKTQDESSVENENKRPSVRYQEGQSIHTLWTNESLGIDPVTGDEVFLDMNGRKVDKWSTDNYKPLGCEDPKFEGNFGTMLRYKGFVLNAYFKYSYGGDIYNKTLVEKVENVDPLKNADRRVLYDRWKQAGDIAKYKAITNTTATMPTSRFIEQQNYITLSSLNLSYEFDLKSLKQIGIQRLKLSAIGNDIFRASTVKMERGIKYPFARTFSLAAQITF